ncbi:MAG: alpha/beta fold hydrolase [Acidimicrobiales bacterium]
MPRQSGPARGNDPHAWLLREDGSVRLHAIRHGEGYPIRFVLVHGLASCARLWDAVGMALAARGHGAVAVDLRGHGDSPKPDDGYDFETITGDLLPFLDNRPVLAGQSFGGNVAVDLAARRPDAVSAIACVDGGAIDLAARFSTVDEAVLALRPPYEEFEGTPLVAQEMYLRTAHADWPETSIEAALAAYDVDTEGRIRSRLSWARHQQIIRAMWNTPPSPRWPQIRVPAVFLMASERMRAGVDAALAALPDAEVVWFDGADHDLHAQKPDEVADHFTRLLARARPGCS